MKQVIPLVFLLFVSTVAAASTVQLPVGENGTHTVTVYNPLDQADTVTVDAAFTGEDRDTFTATRNGDPVTEAPVTLRIPAETNQSFSVELAAQYCTADRCDAQLVFTASSDTTRLQDSLTVDLTTDTGEVEDDDSSTLLLILAAALFAGAVVAAVILRQVLLTGA